MTPAPIPALERALAEAGVSLPWAYRPYHFDDWGFIRGPEKISELIGPYRPVVCNSRQSDVTEERMAEHRVAKTDPYEPVGRLIVAAVNALPVLLALARRAEAAEKALRNIVEHFGDRIDSPGHCHDKPGIWDADNAPSIAGAACEWCAQWTAARALLTLIAEGR